MPKQTREKTVGKDGKTGPVRTRCEREVQRAELPKLLRRGWTQAMIAEKFGVSQAQISCDYKIVMKELRQESAEDIKELVGLKLEEYGEVKREMWEAWEKSKKNQEERLEEDVSSDRGGHTKTAVKEKGSCGDPKFIAIVMECIKQECNLLALNPAKEIRGSLTTSINWDVLSQGIPLNGPVPDEVEEEIRKALGYTDQAKVIITAQGDSQSSTPEGDRVEGDTIYVRPGKSETKSTPQVEEIEDETEEDEEEE